MFESQLANQDTRYFIIDTHGGSDDTSEYEDKDFIQYAWHLSKYKQVRKDDLFIYRRTKSASEYGMFYFFGAGKFGEVELVNDSSDKPVISQIPEFVEFSQLIMQDDERLNEYQWQFKEKKKPNWSNFFNQYGMMQIKKADFEFLLNLGTDTDSKLITQSFSAIEKAKVVDDLETVVYAKEGKRKLVYSYKYERNPKLRDAALDIHGYGCKVCGFDFEKTYGKLGHEFIEVHHIKPLHTVKGETPINPKTDLIPLCANCHRMIHRNKKNIMTVEELKEIINK